MSDEPPDPPKVLPFSHRGYTLLKPSNIPSLRAETSSMVQWLWQDYLPEDSLVMLAAFMKEGKSTFAYELVGAMMTGRRFLERPTRKVPTLVLALEENRREVVRHLDEARVPDDSPMHFHLGFMPNNSTSQNELARYVTEFGIKLVLIDTWSRMGGVKDENDAAEAIKSLGPFLDIARNCHTTILPLHHTKKKVDQVFRYGTELRGSSALFGLLDQALILNRAPGGSKTARVLNAIGRFSETPHEMLLEYDEVDGYRLLSGPLEPAESEVVRAEKLIGFVAENPGLSRNDVQRGARVNRKEGLRILADLVRTGRLTDLDGKVSLPVPR